jgi:hypothetical protein
MYDPSIEFNKPKILVIDWIDSVSDNGWKSSDDCKARAIICQSVGFLVDENDHSVCLALSRTTQQGYMPFADLISIPKVSIKHKRKIG